MRLETLAIRGITRFEQTVAIDFRELPAGLIAIVGENGSGKTTLMEAPIGCLYQEFPTRQSPVYDYATRSDAFIETTFALEGRGVYRARLAVDGPHRKGEASLLEVGPDGTPRSLTDGKLTTYAAAVAGLLPPLPDLLASVFAAQNRAGSFSALDRKGRRELFGSLLGLEHLEAMATTARSAANLYAQAVEQQGVLRSALALQTTPRTDLDARAEALRVAHAHDTATLSDLEVRILAIEDERFALAGAAEAHVAAVIALEAARAKWTYAQARRDALTSDLAALPERSAEEQRRLRDGLQAVLDEHAARMADVSGYEAERQVIATREQAALAVVDKKIAANRGLLEEAAAIRAAAAAHKTCLERRAENADQQRRGHDRLEAHRKRETVLVQSLHLVEAAEKELARARADVGILSRTPFGEECGTRGCEFTAQAVAAKAKIAGLQETIDAKPAVLQELGTVRELLETDRQWLETVKAEAQHIERDLEALGPMLGKLPPLEAAEARIKELSDRRAEAIATAARERAEALARQNATIAGLHEASRRARERAEGDLHAVADAAAAKTIAWQADLAQVEAAVVALRQDVERLEPEVAALVGQSARWRQLTEDVRPLHGEVGRLRTNLARTTSLLDEATRQIAALEAKFAELDALERRIDCLADEQHEWAQLAAALGREGLQALEIDHAGPTVSAFANDLLQACFGGRFTVDLITQEPRLSKGKDGSLYKEVFELRVYDQARAGEARDLADLSGGERVIVEEAFKSAVALLVNARNAHPIRTCWRDETTGALDPDNAVRYIAMLRRVQELGGFHQILFVSHNPDCAALADVQILVADGACTVAYSPFARDVAA